MSDATPMTPKEIVSELDKHIVGQDKAKRSVAVALRNRWRRQQVPEPLRHEIVPKNILMIGPTGVGKTEIARRLARLANAPFIKIEATKFTEVGYVGRDVDTIVRDLVEVAIKQTRETEMRRVRTQAEDAAEDRILDALLPPPRNARGEPEREESNSTRQVFRKRLREGKLDDTQIDIEVAQTPPHMEIMAPPGMEEMTEQLRGMFAGLAQGKTSWTRSTRSPRARNRAAPTSRARACSATCCRWSKAPPSTPSTAWCAPITSCSSPPAPSTCPARRT